MPTPKHRPLSESEKAWIKRLQKTLDACPTKRLGFYTIGDCDVSIYDNRFDDIINETESGEFCSAVHDCDAHLGEVIFPSPVHSTCG